MGDERLHSRATDQTLHDFARNPDGVTYNGLKVMRWLFEASTGTPMSQEEVERIAEQARDRLK